MDRPANALPHVPKWVIIGALWLWFAVALLTHYGARSPYSYMGGVLGLYGARIDGLVVNYDALSVRPVTQFFFDAAPIDFPNAHNLKLPLHSMLVAAAASFLRSYMLANYAVNLLALWLLAYVAVTLADQFAHPRAATLIAALTCAFLPLYTHHIGQPMHYVVGIVVNFLVMLAAMAGVHDPLRLGILTAVLTLSYDPYVFIAALLAWIILALRWRRVRDWLVYAAASLLPVLVWRGFLAVITDKTVSPAVRDVFFKPVLNGWKRVLTAPRNAQLAPFANVHLGLTMSFDMMLALVYWPVVVLCAVALLRTRPRRPPVLLLAVAFVFLLIQLATAAYDWENNPRRAIPLLFAISCAWFFVVAEKVHLRGWRLAFTLTMVISFFLTMSDTFTGNPLVGYLPTGEAMKQETKKVVTIADSHLDTVLYPKLLADEQPRWWSMPRARVSHPFVLVFANLFTGAFVVALLHLLRERALVPRYLPAGVAIALLLSLGARFL